MKRKPQLDESAASSQFDADNFISGAAARDADRFPREQRTQRRTTGRGKLAAKGFTRTSLDLPDQLYEQVKIAAIRQRRTMRECVEEALRGWLEEG